MDREKVIKELIALKNEAYGMWVHNQHDRFLTKISNVCNDTISLLKEQPEIVRCKDCWKRPYDNCPFYEHMDDMTEDDFFCADGERKE